MCTLHDFTCIRPGIHVALCNGKDVELNMQDVETKGNAVNLTTFSY